jgi:tRNA-Thr(GGU) m(6)t(6)A37 methyltransferase TsaA
MYDFRFRPIGVLHSPFDEPKGTPIQGAYAREAEGTAEIYEEFRGGLNDLDGFSHLYLIYVFDRSRDFRLKVKPYRDDTERGVFSTRAPKRPNQIGLSIVRLVEVHSNVLRLAEVDFLDGSPLLDIKPYVPPFDHREDVRFCWLERSQDRTVADGRFHDDQ